MFSSLDLSQLQNALNEFTSDDNNLSIDPILTADTTSSLEDETTILAMLASSQSEQPLSSEGQPISPTSETIKNSSEVDHLLDTISATAHEALQQKSIKQSHDAAHQKIDKKPTVSKTDNSQPEPIVKLPLSNVSSPSPGRNKQIFTAIVAIVFSGICVTIFTRYRVQILSALDSWKWVRKG
jgi:Fic family protein